MTRTEEVVVQIGDSASEAAQSSTDSSIRTVWDLLDGAATWAEAYSPGIPGDLDSFAAQTCRWLVGTLPSHLRAIAVLGRAGGDLLPTATIGARAAFEGGLRVAWVYTGETPAERELRALAVHTEAVAFKTKVAARHGQLSPGGGTRWSEGARSHQRVVDRLLMRHGPARLPKVPNVVTRLEMLELERLYIGYQIASEYTHAGLTMGGELAAGSPVGPGTSYRHEEWALAISLATWGCLLAWRHTSGPQTPTPSPLIDLMTAADVLHQADW